MIYISINPSVDFANTENFYVFFMGDKFKYIKMKSTIELEFIIKTFSFGLDWEMFLIKLKKENFNLKKTISLVQYLLKKEILYSCKITERFNYKKYYLPELYLDSRYGYQMRYLNLRYNFENNQDRIKNKTILIIGGGALGSFIAVMCASIGVKKIKVIDGDYVEESNLTRQIFYKEKDVANNILKVDSLEEHIKRLNSKVIYEGIPEFVNENTNINLFKDVDLIVQTADKPTGKIDRIVFNLSEKVNTPVLYIHNGSVGPFITEKSKKYMDFETKLNKDSNNLYSLSVDYQSKYSRTAYPTMIHEIFPLIYKTFDEILTFLVTGDIPNLYNKIWYQDTNSYEEY